jgi:hypothetical protein
MKNNIDEDIKILEKFIKNYNEVQEKYKDDEIQAEIERSCYFEEVPAKAISNVLSEVKDYQNHKKYHCEQLEKVLSEIESYKNRENKELETYKKIAEKLAEEVEKLHTFLVNEYGTWQEDYVIENDINTNKQCIIDWARKEVEKE